MRRELTVNGLPVRAFVSDADVEGLLVPLLEEIGRAHERAEAERGAGARAVVFLAAPPGSGKSTLAALLEALSEEGASPLPLRALGMDGFHYPNAYLDSHHLGDDPARPTLRQVKGAPETFDLAALAGRLRTVRGSTGPVRWPGYSRVLHDVVPDALLADRSVILVEGNYLLLDEPGWRDLGELCDLSVYLEADEGVLRERLVGRKVAGGMPRAEAEEFYLRSDGPNVRRVVEGSLPASVTLRLAPERPEA